VTDHDKPIQPDENGLCVATCPRYGEGVRGGNPSKWCSRTSGVGKPCIPRAKTSEQISDLALVLENDTRFYSDFEKITNHPNFTKLKNKENIIPYLIDRLKEDPHWWVILLLDEIIDNPPEYPEESRDAQSVENADSFEDWASSLGYDIDSRKAEKIYKACIENQQNIRRFLGTDFDTFAEACQDY
jgi:hypothetical protein